LILTSPAPTKCVATWYDMHGQRTASGTRMHRDSLTAAYNFAKFGTILEVTNIATAVKCTVTVTDRMGVKSSNRIDLSYAAFGCIAKRSQGRISVRLRKLN
jgi:rare lipoprotein A